MAGKIIYKSGFFLLALLLFLPSFGYCGKGQWIAVLISESEQVFEAPVQSFSDSVSMEVRVFNLQGDIRKDPGLKDRMFAEKPAMIFALGAKAAFVAKLWTRERQDVPVIFADIINDLP